MLISSLKIWNFKGINAEEGIRLDFKPITLLFGPNNGGKSTVLHALQYLHEIFCQQSTQVDRTELGGDFVNLGGFASMVHGKDLSQKISFQIDLDLSGTGLPDYSIQPDEGKEFEEFRRKWARYEEALGEVESASVHIDIAWSVQKQTPFVSKYEVAINKQVLATIVADAPKSPAYVQNLDVAHPILRDQQETELVIHELKEETEQQDKRTQEPIVNPLDGLALAAALFVPQLRPAVGAYAAYRVLSTASDVQVEELPEEEKVALPALNEIVLADWQYTGALPVFGKPLEMTLPQAEDESEIDEQTSSYFLSSLIAGPGELISEALDKLLYIGPMRTIPGREFIPQQTKSKGRWASGLAAWDRLAAPGMEKLREDVGEALHACELPYNVVRRDSTNVEAEFLIEKLKKAASAGGSDEALLQAIQETLASSGDGPRILFHDPVRNIDLHPLELGVGLSQALPILVATLDARRNAIISVEQPELHVHPAIQVEMGDLFIRSTKDNKDKVILLETHSEHLLLRLLKRIRQTTNQELGDRPELHLTPEELAIWHLESAPSGGRCNTLGVDKEGEFTDRWPNGFFLERLKELV